MNIFVLDLDPRKCAEYHNNRHVVKMVLETSQLLCGVHWVGGSEAPYKLSHRNHPCAIWSRECIENYIWLCDLGMALSVDGKSLFDLNASRVVGTPHFYANHYKENGNYFTLEYARVRFEEIYYHDASLGDKRKIIHVDEAQRVTEYKDLMYEFNIIMCSKYYRVDSRDFRTFIPRY